MCFIVYIYIYIYKLGFSLVNLLGKSQSDGSGHPDGGIGRATEWNDGHSGHDV